MAESLVPEDLYAAFVAIAATQDSSNRAEQLRALVQAMPLNRKRLLHQIVGMVLHFHLLSKKVGGMAKLCAVFAPLLFRPGRGVQEEREGVALSLCELARHEAEVFRAEPEMPFRALGADESAEGRKTAKDGKSKKPKTITGALNGLKNKLVKTKDANSIAQEWDSVKRNGGMLLEQDGAANPYAETVLTKDGSANLKSTASSFPNPTPQSVESGSRQLPNHISVSRDKLSSQQSLVSACAAARPGTNIEQLMSTPGPYDPMSSMLNTGSQAAVGGDEGPLLRVADLAAVTEEVVSCPVISKCTDNHEQSLRGLRAEEGGLCIRVTSSFQK